MSVLALLLAVLPPARALDWWVPDAAAAARVSGALGRLWAGSDVAVRVGAPSEPGVWYADGRLTLVTPAGRREAAVPDDVDTEVVLVRAWTRALGDGGGEPVVTPRSGWIPTAAVAGGPGTAVASGGAPVHLGVAVGASWRSLEVGGVGLADLGAVVASDLGTPVGDARVGAGLVAGARLPLWGGEYVTVVGPVVRLRAMRDRLDPAARSGEPVVGVTERMAWWWRATPSWVVGVGLTGTVDDLPHALGGAQVTLPNGRAAAPLPAQVAVEVGLAWRPVVGAP